MDEFLRASNWDLPDTTTLIRISSRMITAVVLAGAMGWERERHGRAAGLRTHMMVGLGAALFTLIPLETNGTQSDVAEIVKGIAAGVGFLGAGAILKLAHDRDVLGLTTASSIWLTAAVGLAAGAGQCWAALIATVLSLIILAYLPRIENLIPEPKEDRPKESREDHYST